MESTPTLFVLNMAAAAALLIWAVRLVRTRFERAFGGELQLWLRRSTANRYVAAVSGGLAAILMQSSTAVAMLMAGFVSSSAWRESDPGRTFSADKSWKVMTFFWLNWK